MRLNNISLSDTDVKTITFALSVLPSLDLADTAAQSQINAELCMSAAKKLIYRRGNLLLNEWRVIYASLEAVLLILQGEYQADAELKAECAPYLFSVNALLGRLPPLPPLPGM